MYLLQSASDILLKTSNAPLVFYFHKRDPALYSNPLIVSHAHRLRNLLLQPLKRCNLPTLQTLLCQTPVPLLSELRVHFEPSRMDFTSYHHPILIGSIDSCFLSLRSIRLQKAVAWTLPALARMRYLNLRNCTALDTHLIFDQFLVVLEGCNELEDLRLHGFLTTIAHHVPAGFARTVLLPCLRRLTIRRAALCRQFHSAVHLPPTIILRVFGQIDPNVDPKDAQRLFTSILPEDLSSLPVIRTLKYARFDGELEEKGMCFRMWSDPRHPGPFGAGSLLPVLDWEQTQVERYNPQATPRTRSRSSLTSSFTPLSKKSTSAACRDRCPRPPPGSACSALRVVHTLTILPGETLRPV